MKWLIGWYGTCVLVGAASSWIGGFIIFLVLVVALFVAGIALALARKRQHSLPIHHAFVGLAISLTVSKIFPVAVFALGPGF